MIAIVVSEFNAHITEKLLEGAVLRLTECGKSDADMVIINVPGAVEIPLTVKLLAASHRYQAIIALGAVIRGETTHYDYVCEQVSQGCQQVMMAYELPVIFGVLTTENDAQAYDRIGGKHGHKGIEAADTAMRMIDVVKMLK